VKKKQKHAELGGGLVYFLLLSAIIGVVVVTLQRKASQDMEDIRTEELKTMRDGIYKRVNALATAEDALRASLNHPSNTAYKNCLTNAQSCSFKSPFQRGEFTLVDPSLSIPIQSRSGEKGGICSGAQCVFEAKTYFWVTCAASAPLCTAPERLYTLTQVQILPQFFAANTSVMKPSMIAAKPSSLTNPHNPGDPDYILRLANSISASDVTQQKQLCPPGAEIGGFDDKGNVKCKCIGGLAYQTGTDPNTGMPICKGSDQTCPTGQEFRGFYTTADGKFQKICVAPRYDSCIIVQTVGNTVNCGTDANGNERLLQGISNSKTKCELIGSADIIKCSPVEAKCCSQSL
jgi:hypothetical protein